MNYPEWIEEIDKHLKWNSDLKAIVDSWIAEYPDSLKLLMDQCYEEQLSGAETLARIKIRANFWLQSRDATRDRFSSVI